MKKRSTIKVVVATLVVRRVLVKNQFLTAFGKAIAGGIGDGLKDTINKSVDSYNERHPDSKLQRIPDWPRHPVRRPITYTRQSNPGRISRPDVVMSTREEAELILEKMADIIETYGVVSVHDLKELMGHPSTPVDGKWGWVDLSGGIIRQVREGFFLDFPSPRPLR